MSIENKFDDIKCCKASGAPGTHKLTCRNVKHFQHVGNNWASSPNAYCKPPITQIHFWVHSQQNSAHVYANMMLIVALFKATTTK